MVQQTAIPRAGTPGTANRTATGTTRARPRLPARGSAWEAALAARLLRSGSKA